MVYGLSIWHLWLFCVSCPPVILSENLPSGGVHLPIVYGHHKASAFRRFDAGQVAVGGLGDYEDISYNILVKFGKTLLPLLLDTGSADLWAISDACPKNCSRSLPTIPHKTFNYSGVDARLFYGDSSTGTYAFGPIGREVVQLANLSIAGQFFAAINKTDTTIVSTLSVGVLGLGFPVNSAIWNTLFNHQFPPVSNTSTTTTTPSRTTKSPRSRRTHSVDHSFVSRSRILFDVTAGMQSLATVDQLLKTFITNGPVVARMSFSGLLKQPSFTVTLQRDTVDIGGNAGLLSLGELPPGVSNSSLTWTRVRQYTVEQGGIPPPPAAPNEVYPISWELPLDNVYLDGAQLPQSTLSTGVSLSALIDTGSSLIRGPSDVVSEIYRQISGDETLSTYDCSVPHTLEFEIGGSRFPVDPRDFGWQAAPDSLQLCNASIVVTDPPSKGFLYAWTLGVPFLKSVLVSCHYGNLTNPSVDPARIGLVSTMPSDAKDRLLAAIKAAGKNFPAIIETPPISVPNFTRSGIAGVALAPTHPLSSLPTSTNTLTSASGNLGSSTTQASPSNSHNGGMNIRALRPHQATLGTLLGVVACLSSIVS